MWLLVLASFSWTSMIFSTVIKEINVRKKRRKWGKGVKEEKRREWREKSRERKKCLLTNLNNTLLDPSTCCRILCTWKKTISRWEILGNMTKKEYNLKIRHKKGEEKSSEAWWKCHKWNKNSCFDWNNPPSPISHFLSD